MARIQELLFEWGFDDNVIQNFLDHEIELGQLSDLTDEYIKELVPKIGDRINLRKKIKERQEALKQATASSSNSLNTNIKSIDVNEIIKNSMDGINICELYEQQQFLTDLQRVKLIKVILDETFEKKFKLSRCIMDDITNQICVMFPSEVNFKTTYYEPHHGGQPTGILHQTYYNRLSAMNRKKNKTGNERSPAEVLVDCLLEGDVRESIDYLKDIENNNPELILQHWKNTFRYRQIKMKLCKTFEEILGDWPHLAKPSGFSLIHLDFVHQYDDKSADSLKNNWNSFFETNFNLLQQSIKDIKARKSLLRIESEENYDTKSVAIALALHNLLPPGSRFVKNKRWKPTTEDSKNTFFINVARHLDIRKELKIRQETCLLKEIQCHPIIFGIGPSKDQINEFVVAIDNLTYKFESFADALDAAFKMFQILNLKYPPESEKVWAFLNEVFYNVKIDMKTCPKLQSVVAGFKKIN